MSSSASSSSEDEAPSPSLANSNKRKRTGKQRAELKAKALAAAAAALDAGEGSRKKRKVEEDAKEGQGEAETIEQKADGDTVELEAESQPSAPVVDIEAVKKRIPQALKSLLTILKKSKVTETQRLIKKVKFLRSEQKDGEHAVELLDLETQLELLKATSLPSLTHPLLSLKLSKHYLLRSHPPSSYIAPIASTSTPPTQAQTKLENRLYSSKGTSEAIKGVVGWCAGEDGGSLRVVKGVPSRQQGKVGGAGKAIGDGGEVVKVVPVKKEAQKENTKAKAVILEEDAMDEDALADAAGWESGSLRDEDKDDEEQGFDEDLAGPSRLAPASSDEDDSDSDSESPSSPSLPPPSSKSKSTKAPPASAAKTKPVPKNITSSLFLPSLSAGYTMGDAGEFSDPEEDEKRDKKSGKGQGAERKNRRGQRERKAIWEKKYGKNANHVKQQVLEEKKADMAKQFLQAQGGKFVSKKNGGVVGDSGWASRGGAGTSAPATSNKSWNPTAAPTPAPPPSKPIPEKAVHPSWEAARVRKEKELALQNAPAVKPKKIVFD